MILIFANLIQAFQRELKDLAIISDQEKGLLEAMKVLLPHVEHRVCMGHLWKNFKDSRGLLLANNVRWSKSFYT